MPNSNINACRSGAPDISAHPDVIAVSSVDQSGKKIERSGYGTCLQFLGPTSPTADGGLTTTDRTGIKGFNKGDNDLDLEDLDYTSRFYGTSAATPAVAGVFGLVYSQDSSLSSEQALEQIKKSTTKLQTNESNGLRENDDPIEYDLSLIHI